jgi:phasin family protein
MANPRQEDKSNQNAEQTIRQASERTAEQTKRVGETAVEASQEMARTGMSREYFAFVRHQMESSMNRMNELWGCRTPQEIAAVQSDFVRETLESAVESSRRMADMSLKAADDAAKQMAQNI